MIVHRTVRETAGAAVITVEVEVVEETPPTESKTSCLSSTAFKRLLLPHFGLLTVWMISTAAAATSL